MVMAVRLTPADPVVLRYSREGAPVLAARTSAEAAQHEAVQLLLAQRPQRAVASLACTSDPRTA